MSWDPIKQRPHHLAIQLTEYGIETFWGNPDGRRETPVDCLHIVGPEDELNPRRPLVIIYYPFHFEKIKEYNHPLVIYDVLDDISIHDKLDAEAGLPEEHKAREYHHRLLERGDLVITSSQTLRERLNQVRSDVLLVPNGVDLGHFAIGRVEMADALIKIERPIIGFHGAIAEWLDYELLLKIVRQRGQYQFVLVGPASWPKRVEKIRKEPNVHYLGSQPYNEIPQYVAGFDVGILPFIIDTVTYGVGSLQTLECLAMGKPVVATPLPEAG